MVDQYGDDFVRALHLENEAYLQRMLAQEAEIAMLRAEVKKLQHLIERRHQLDPVEIAAMLNATPATRESDHKEG